MDIKKFIVSFIAIAAFPIPLAALDLRGSLGVEARYFTQHQDFQPSIFIEPKAYWENESSQHSLTFKPFARWDQQDNHRSHGDIRELFYQYASDSFELRAGINKIFWGVTESQHLVDVINQTDKLEGFDGEDKLGQPMLQLTFIRDWGVIDAFVLPYFREQKFAGPDGHFNIRLEFQNRIYNADIKNAIYESDDENHHLDTAFRYSHSRGNWDFGISYFDGTQRDPGFVIGEINPLQQKFVVTPYYLQMQQWGVDLQATMGAWLWKTEVISRRLQNQSLTAATTGFEYTFYGLSQSGGDLGVLVEMSQNDSPELAPSIAQSDIFLGGRYTWNDQQSSELFFGISQDLNHATYAIKIEASRRVGDNYKISLDSWLFDTNDQQDLLYNIRTEDFIQLSLDYYF